MFQDARCGARAVDRGWRPGGITTAGAGVRGLAGQADPESTARGVVTSSTSWVGSGLARVADHQRRRLPG